MLLAREGFSGTMAFFSLLAFVPGALAQAGPDCTNSSYSWTSNSLGQDPCVVVSYLEAVCSSGGFSLGPLIPGNHYTGPDEAQAGDLCMCNTVVYSLLSACDGCQNGQWIPWSEYNGNCSSIITPGTLGYNIPSGTRVPQWAYLDPTQTNDTWDFASASSIGDGAESTATGGPTTVNPSATSVSASITQASTSTAAPSDTAGASHGSSHAGAIAGGVVGGVVGVAALAGLITFFLIRRKRSRIPPSAMYTNAVGSGVTADGAGGSPAPYGQWDQSTPAMSEMPTTPRRYYDPSDPSTFPTSPSPSSPTIHTTANTYKSGQNSLQPNRSTYAGLPEV